MPSRDALTLAESRRIGIRLTWPEAVALVIEAADRVKRSDGTCVTPDFDHILISPDGITILPGSPIPPHPVRQAARLLADLLQDAAAPTELRTLIAQNQKDPPACAWLEEFTTALAYFERPHRQQIITGLVARTVSERARTAAAAEETPLLTSSDGSGLMHRENESGWRAIPARLRRLFSPRRR